MTHVNRSREIRLVVSRSALECITRFAASLPIEDFNFTAGAWQSVGGFGATQLRAFHATVLDNFTRASRARVDASHVTASSSITRLPPGRRLRAFGVSRVATS